jgi:hypothetical protein
MCQEKNYNFFWNVKGNGAMYKKFKLKKIKLICYVQFLQITFFTFKGHNLLNFSSISTFFVPLDAPRKGIQSLLEC